MDEAVEDLAAAMIVGGTHTGGISVEYHDDTGFLDIDMANDGHTHDTRYFTETELGGTAISTAGAYLIGVYAGELDHSAATNVQDVLDDLDQAITDVTTGGYTDEEVRDVVGVLMTDTADIDFIYTDNGNATSTIVANILQVDGGTFV